MSNDEPKLFNSRIHEMCPCDRVLKDHCEAFKLDGGLFYNCVYRLASDKKEEDTE